MVIRATLVVRNAEKFELKRKSSPPKKSVRAFTTLPRKKYRKFEN